MLGAWGCFRGAVCSLMDFGGTTGSDLNGGGCDRASEICGLEAMDIDVTYGESRPLCCWSEEEEETPPGE